MARTINPFAEKAALETLERFNKLWDSGEIIDICPHGPSLDHIVIMGFGNDRDPRLLEYRTRVVYLRNLMLHAESPEKAKENFRQAKERAAKLGQKFPADINWDYLW